VRLGLRRLRAPMRRGVVSAASIESLRCRCGRLLARVRRSVIELKCARCKRVVLLVGGRRYEDPFAGRCECLEDLHHPD
jgi:hypothetical protein